MSFSRTDLVNLLNKLTERLNELGIQGTFHIVGGAAIALKYADRPPTHDIDAEFIFKDSSRNELREVVAEIALSEGITAEWINDYAKVFVPPHATEDWIEYQFSEGIKIFVASAPLLLAMKLRATRGVRDTEDILALLAACEVSTLEDAVVIYAQYQENELLTETALAIITAYLNKEGPLRH